MVRTILSCGALFGSLLAAVALLQEASRERVLHDAPAAEPSRSIESQEASRRENDQPRLASRPEQTSAVEPAPIVQFPSSSLIRLVAYDEETDGEAAGLRSVIKNTAEERTEESFFERDEAGNESASEHEFETSEARQSEDELSELKEPARFHIQSDDIEPELDSEMIELREKIRDCLAYYYQRPENVASRSPWGCMHWMIAYGVDAELIAGDRKVNAIGYLNYNGTCNGQQLFYLANGQIQTNIGPGVQGHAGQYLAMLAQSRVKTDYPMLIDGQQFTVADLIAHEQRTCRPQTELTFKLIALSHYLRSDQRWKSNDGEIWDIQRLIKEELAQPIIGAACGGTHRLTGFSYAVRKREQRKEPITGQWSRAQKFIEDYHEYTYKLQNPDGSFSTNWFAGRQDEGAAGRRLETTGHITEWLAFSLSKEDLTDPRMVKAVEYLTNLLVENRNEKWGIGPLGHGLHALALYDERMFAGQPGKRAEQLAGRPRVMQRVPTREAENRLQSLEPGLR